MRRALVSLTIVFALAAFADGAAATSTWDKKHPRQHKVLKGANRQSGRTYRALHGGKLTVKQALALNRGSRAIKQEDRRDATISGGFITQGQTHHMLHQEQGLARQRRHDEKVDATAK